MKLLLNEIEDISSSYLSEERKKEVWKIQDLDIDENNLLAIISMNSYVVSNTDNNEFHLSYLTAMEIVSQLQIIYMHVWAGYKKKTKEVWMLESHIKTHRPIKNHDSIQVKMIATKIFKRNNAYYCTAEHQVTDDNNGLFEIFIKAKMA